MKWPFLLLSSLLLATACETPEMPLAGATGRAGELIVVMKESYWKGAAGDTVFNTLSQHVYGLPQPEPMFNVVHIKSTAFTRIFQTHRNIVYIKIDKDSQKSIELKTDVWATPQVVIEITAPSAKELIEIFGNNSSRILGHIMNKEQERIQKSYKSQLNNDVVTPLKTKWGLTMNIPNGYHLVRDEEDFSWIRYETQDVTQSVLIYSEPYTRDDTFTKNGMIAVIDSFSRKYIPGPDKNTYMTTYLEYPPLLEEKSIGDKYASKLTGLWKVEGALMGGPFVSYAFLDAAEKRVYYLHGFVFSPGKKKRNYLRQVDAILNSAKLN